MWGAACLGIASGWAVFGFFTSCLQNSGDLDGALSAMNTVAPSRVLTVMGATIVGGAVAGFLSQHRILPAAVIAASMTANFYVPTTGFGFALPHDQYVGAMIMLFISATFGQSVGGLWPLE